MIKVIGGPTRVLTSPFPSMHFNLSQCQLQDNMEQVFPKDPWDCLHSLLRSTWARDHPRYKERCIHPGASGLRPRQSTQNNNGTLARTSECSPYPSIYSLVLFLLLQTLPQIHLASLTGFFLSYHPLPTSNGHPRYPSVCLTLPVLPEATPDPQPEGENETDIKWVLGAQSC